MRSYEEFINAIKERGLPKCISFDYDLVKGQPSGYDCAIWLIDYCNERDLELPQVLVHSWNTDGADIIKAAFRVFKK